MSEFLEMGGYALYVWSSYGIAAIALIATAWAGHKYHGDQRARIARRLRRETAESDK